jgi:hypothetical protein
VISGLSFDERCLISIALRDYADNANRRKNAKGARQLTEKAKQSQEQTMNAARALLGRIYNGIENA